MSDLYFHRNPYWITWDFMVVLDRVLSIDLGDFFYTSQVLTHKYGYDD